MPETARRIAEQLGIGREAFDKFTIEDIKTWGKLKSGQPLNKTNPLFPRIDTK
jgi:methionyl-tRNA synthetase